MKDSSVYTGSMMIATVFSILQAVITARILGPALYGVLQIYRLILMYSMHAGLGILWAMLREIPFHKGKGELDKIEEIKNVTFSTNMALACIGSLLIVIIAFFLRKTASISMLGVTFVALIAIEQHFQYYLEHYLLAQKQFSLRSRVKVIYTMANLVGVCVFGYFFKLPGVLVAMFLSFAIVNQYTMRAGKFKPRFVVNIKESIRLIKIGVPILGNGVSNNLMASVDKFMIIKFFDTTALGYYGLATMIKQFMGVLYMSIFMTIFPNLAEQLGKHNNDIKSIKNYVLKPMIVSAYLSPLFLGSIALVIPFLIKYFLPQYTPVTFITQIAVVSFFFGILQAGIPNFLIVTKKIHHIYPFRAAVIILNAVLIYIAVRLNKGLLGVAFCTMASSFVFSTLLSNNFLHHYKVGFRSRIRFYIQNYVPFVYMIGCLFSVSMVSIGIYQGIPGDIITFLIRSLLFFALNIPLIIYINKKTGIIMEMKKFAVHLWQEKTRRPVSPKKNGKPIESNA
ncbi:MAG: oligosaccharide flippase family protein [Candidatus Omnitrophica bacterium]|nr:oligosaccharide flippase family protein [Candidatus Omnitrophota bacterium]